MYAALYQYLVRNHELSVPGIGTFLLNRKPAEINFPDKLVHPPVYSITHHFPASPHSNGLFYWLSRVMGISDREAVIRFNDFAFDMRKQLLNGSNIHWKGVGVLSSGLGGEIRFAPWPGPGLPERPVKAEKVIREKPVHLVRVGEEEKTAAEMEQILAKEDVKKQAWWAWPLIIGILAVIFIGWYLSTHGVQLSSTGHQKQMVPVTAPPAYKTMR